jgi:hypothetical protein
LEFIKIYWEKLPGQCTASRFEVGSSTIKYETFCFLPNVTFLSQWNLLTLMVKVVEEDGYQDFIAEYSTRSFANVVGEGSNWVICQNYYPVIRNEEDNTAIQADSGSLDISPGSSHNLYS